MPSHENIQTTPNKPIVVSVPRGPIRKSVRSLLTRPRTPSLEIRPAPTR